MATLRSLASRLVRILGPDPRAVAQSAVALVISIIATLIAGPHGPGYGVSVNVVVFGQRRGRSNYPL